MNDFTDKMNVEYIDNAIQKLNEYAKVENLRDLISILEALKQDPRNESLLEQLTNAWRNLGVYQGTVLTYVPDFYTLIPDDIFGDNLKK
ncbi:MAG: hypothetical protein OQL11_08385 [Gammaproteobacteria bacterium]|nr:hypothetical protein [Gammaproteobacteria bacterium]